MCPVPNCESHPLAAAQEAGSLQDLKTGGKSKKSDQGKLVKNDTGRNNGFLP